MDPMGLSHSKLFLEKKSQVKLTRDRFLNRFLPPNMVVFSFQGNPSKNFNKNLGWEQSVDHFSKGRRLVWGVGTAPAMAVLRTQWTVS